jgi:hypothetical protein
VLVDLPAVGQPVLGVPLRAALALSEIWITAGASQNLERRKMAGCAGAGLHHLSGACKRVAEDFTLIRRG